MDHATKWCLPARYAVPTCMADPPWSMGAAGRPLRVERTCCTCASGAQERRWVRSDAGRGTVTSRGLESGITHTASSPACAAARGVRRPPASSRLGGARVRGCAGARVEAVWVEAVWWWEAV